MEMEIELVISPVTILVNLGRACFMIALQNLYSRGGIYRNREKEH